MLAKKYVLRILIAACGLTGLSGCFIKDSPASKFYRLSALETVGAETAPAKAPSIGIGPLSIPGYLDKPQIAARVSENEISYSEFHRWAESIKEDLGQTLADNLGVLLKTDQVYIYPWNDHGPVDYQILLNLERFEGAWQGQARLEARWRVLDRSGLEIAPMRRSVISETSAPADYAGWVKALSKAVASLSREIASVIELRARKAK